MNRRHLLAAAVAGTLASYLAPAAAQSLPKEIRVDYAYYSPPSLVLKKFGWLEEEFKADNIPIRWIFSQGSNRSLELINSGSADFGSTAGLAAVLSRANGNPVKGVYVYERPEWAALVVPKDSPIRSVADLKGRKVAATKGTDPYLFLLRALHTAGLTRKDIEHVALQHPDGRVALEQRRVDAWAGLDPHMAASELEAGTRLLYRNVSFNTYGFLNTTDSFAARHPDAVRRVIKAYERARKWILANPDAAAQLVADEAKMSLAVARRQLSRIDFGNPVPGDEHVKALKAAGPLLVEEDLVRKNANIDAVIDALVDPSFARAVIR
jgi:sulfonate transport system substrate-binding protein